MAIDSWLEGIGVQLAAARFQIVSRLRPALAGLLAGPVTMLAGAESPEPAAVIHPGSQRNYHIPGPSGGGTAAEASAPPFGILRTPRNSSGDAVIGGLRWLKEHQSADGSWSPEEFTPSMTGLALLCFLGHGDLPGSSEFGPTVERALNWVLARALAAQGQMVPLQGGPNAGVYEHAILTYVMARYYSMSADPRFAEVLTQAAGYIVAGQTAQGGWDYHYRKTGRNDLSVSGWQIKALQAVQHTGLEIPGLAAALEKSAGFLRSFQGKEGGFGYEGADDRWNLTGVGVYGLYMVEPGRDRPMIKAGLDYLFTAPPEIQYQSATADLHAWYFHTQACVAYGGMAWTKWNKLYHDVMINSQSPDGSWPVMAGQAPGHLQEKAGGAGPFYRTTLAVLMLNPHVRMTVN